MYIYIHIYIYSKAAHTCYKTCLPNVVFEIPLVKLAVSKGREV